jgi:hypothetical protein
MLRRALVPLVGAVALSLIAATPNPSALSSMRIVRWPPWLSIESPVNPWDPASRGVAFYVHTMSREGVPSLADVTASAEGLVNGARRTVPLELAATTRPGVFSVRRSWPADGAWIVRVSLLTTTALIVLDRDGSVGSVRIPTERTSGGVVPRSISQREVDSTLTELAKR